MSAIFVTALPHLNVDRQSEFCYMGAPYKMILQDRPRIYSQDPFFENGPHAVYISAYIAHHFHALKPMRYYHFLYSLLIMAMMYLLFFELFPSNRPKPWEIPIIALIMLTVWISIPLSLVYPVQFNGMMPGFACFLLGLIWNKKRPYTAMLLFGFAYTFKGQFLAMMPGIMLYKLFFEKGSDTWFTHAKRLAISLFLFFAPGTLILSALFWMVGLFDSLAELKAYALRAPTIIFTEMSYILPVVLGHTSTDPQGAATRSTEYSGFGLLAWGLIWTSILFCFGAIVRAFDLKRRGREAERNDLFTVFGMAGLCYWFNYLFFWRYPFWYNVLPVVLFNILLIPMIIFEIKLQVDKRFGAKAAMAFMLIVGVLFGRHLYRRLFVNPLWDRTQMGDMLQPYAWMEKA